MIKKAELSPKPYLRHHSTLTPSPQKAILNIKMQSWGDFPGGPEVKSPPCNAGDTGSCCGAPEPVHPNQRTRGP